MKHMLLLYSLLISAWLPAQNITDTDRTNRPENHDATISEAADHTATTLENCCMLARRNYPQIKEHKMIEDAARLDITNARLAWAPGLNISGKATWQNVVVEMPFDIPGFEFDLPHDQYTLSAELNQPLWDGGAARSQIRLARAGADVDRSQLDVTLRALDERVENLYLGILLLERQMRQNRTLQESLKRNRREAEVRLSNGLALQSEIDLIDVNLLDCEQQADEIEADRQTRIRLLSRMTGRELNEKDIVEPELKALQKTADGVSDSILLAQRPEMTWYDAQLRRNEAQRSNLNTALSPRLSLSLQGGIGRPGLNMLKNEFEPFFVAGLKMQWNIGALYTRRNDIGKIRTQRERVETEKETFLFNTRLDVMDQNNAIDKLQKMLEKDRKIISLRASVRASAEEQYKKGVIKMTELMDRIDEEHNARVSESLHYIQLLMAIYKLRHILGTDYTATNN